MKLCHSTVHHLPESSSSQERKPSERVRPLQHLISSLVLYDGFNLSSAQEAAILLVKDESRVNIAELLVLLADPLLFASGVGMGMAALELLALLTFADAHDAGGVGLLHFEKACRRMIDLLFGSCRFKAL